MPSSTLIIGARVVDVQYVAVDALLAKQSPLRLGLRPNVATAVTSLRVLVSTERSADSCEFSVTKFCGLVAWRSDLKTMLVNNYGIHYQMCWMCIIMMNRGFHTLNSLQYKSD